MTTAKKATLLGAFLVPALALSSGTAFAHHGEDHTRGGGQGHQQTEFDKYVEECEWDDPDSDLVDADLLAGTVTWSGTTDLWPPNHKYRDAEGIWAVTDMPSEGNVGDSFAGTYDSTHNQLEADGTEQNGAGNTSDDIIDDAENSGSVNSVVDEDGTDVNTGTDTVNFQVRAERTGKDRDGREYSVIGNWTITDVDQDGPDADRETTCEFELHLYVPHDQGNQNNGGRVNPDGSPAS